MIEQILMKIRESILSKIRYEIVPYNYLGKFCSYYIDENECFVVTFSDLVAIKGIFNKCEIEFIFLHEVGHIINNNHNIPENMRNIDHEYNADKLACERQHTNEYDISALQKFIEIIQQESPSCNGVNISIFDLKKRINHLKQFSFF